jgi:hypothetical protein
MKNFLWIGLILFAFGLGIYLASGSWLPTFKRHDDEQGTVLLERIEKVAKLVTVDGYFSEVYNYKDYYGYDWSIFRKKALIRIKAHVLAGYDLEQINLDANSANHTITLSQLPKPEILSIDHDLDYYDLTEGTFNSFTNEDLTRLNEQAKNYIEQAASKSDLLTQAEARGKELIETIRFLVEAQGWRINIEMQTIEDGHGAN